MADRNHIDMRERRGCGLSWAAWADSLLASSARRSMAHDFRCPERRQSFLLPPDMRDWLPEDALRGAQHALCNAHHLRELQALIEIEREPWASVMHALLRAANKQVCEARAGGAVALVEADKQHISVAYDAALALGFALHEGQAALLR